ncbi:MAG: cytochrome b [Rhizobiaceae bacterium]
MNKTDRPRPGEFTNTKGTSPAGSYDSVSIALHWLTAVLVVVQFLLAEFWDFFNRPTRHEMITAHMSFGILLGTVIVVRILWRVAYGRKMPSAASGLAGAAAQFVHRAFYVLLAMQVVLGFILRWSGNEAMSFFGLQLPPPFAPFSKAGHEVVDQFHNVVGWTIIVLAFGHALFAILHHYVLKDGLLKRMAPALGR